MTKRPRSIGAGLRGMGWRNKSLDYEETWDLYNNGVISGNTSIYARDITDAQGHFLMFDKMLSSLGIP